MEVTKLATCPEYKEMADGEGFEPSTLSLEG